MQNESRVALVTGASRGIGFEIANRLANDGFNLLLVSSDLQHLEKARQRLTATPSQQVEICAVDLRRPSAGKAVLAAMEEQFPRLDVLVNCAGATKGGALLQLDEETWQDGFALKFFGAVRLCTLLWPKLSESKGSVINIVGGFSRTPSSEFLIAGSVNAALTNFSKGLAGQGLKDDVNVNVIHPGTTETERLDDILQTRSQAEGLSVDQIRTSLAQREKVRRIGKPGDVASLVSFLSTPEARHLNGTSIAVDGGATRSIF